MEFRNSSSFEYNNLKIDISVYLEAVSIKRNNKKKRVKNVLSIAQDVSKSFDTKTVTVVPNKIINV